MHSYTFLFPSVAKVGGGVGAESGPQNVRIKQLANKSYVYYQPTYQLISKKSQFY